MIRVVFAVLALLAVGLAIPSEQVHPGYTFEEYTQDHAKKYTADEVDMRRVLFHKSLVDVMAHNAGHSTYKKTINEFSDRTREELRAPMGGKNSAFFNYQPKSQLEFDLELKPVSDLPESVDWRSTGVVTAVKDQAQCGSCWAFATTETIESYVGLSNKYHSPPVLSPQQIVSCVPNPNHCGGTGGCMGGIPEIAYDYIKQEGGQTEEFFYGYTSAWGTSGTCKFDNSGAAGGTPAIATLDGFVKLPVNNYTAVMNTLASVGPLAINVAAMEWHAYESGVYDGCTASNVDIDHVVQLVGYGVDADSGVKYWTVRNSWTSRFGEGGYIRMLRSDGTDPVCGIDTAPLDGTGCTGGPSSVKVCGPCGLLYDTSYPVGARFLSK